MGNSRRPSSRSRFEVPLNRESTRSKRYQGKQRSQGLGETNRALLNGLIIGGATVLTTLFLLAISGQIYDSTNASLIQQSAPTTIAIAFSSPSPTPSLATSSPSPPKTRATPAPTVEIPASTPDDTVIQSEIDRKLSADGNLASLGITATVNDGKVILVGTAPSDELKAKVERLVRSIAGVKVVDNQIAVVVN
ncbi:MAG TPA: BON domain-containing protein [Pyrinomonadaceae bacterium]|nr:BON domain-containing protein [Pyrinomonadaceae bacterium]